MSPELAVNGGIPVSTRTLEGIARNLATRVRREIPIGAFLPAAVAVPLVATSDGLAVLFTVRTAQVAQHKGEISFPGGRVDPDDRDTLAAALREAEEEVGLRPADVAVLGPFDDFVSITGYRVTPHVVHVTRADYPFQPAPREVAEILLVPLDHLLDPSQHHAVPRVGERWLIHYFRWGPHVIWGLTAAILKRFLDVFFGYSGPR